MTYIIVAAYPAAETTIMVCSEPEREIERKNVLLPQLEDTLLDICSRYSDVENITFYGPKSYIEAIAAKALTYIHPSIGITVEKAGM